MVNVKRRKKGGGTVYSKQANLIQNIYLYENAKDGILNAIKQNLGPFAHSKLCFLDPSLWPVFFPFQFPPVSHLLTFSLLLPLLQQSVADFHLFFFFSPHHLHINPRTSRLPSQGAGNGENVAKAWLRCQFMNTAPWETAWMKGPMPLENYPQVICHTVEQNKHSDTSIYSQSKMDTLVPTWGV